jgi:hypothetical protein
LDTEQFVRARQQSGIDENLTRKKIFDRVASELAAATRQIIALDLDRSTPRHVLGIGRNSVMVLFCAKTFGHEVLVACRQHLSNSRIPKVFHVPCFEQKTRSDLPEGPFDLIVCEGNPRLSTMQSWAGFVRPLAKALTDDGEIFVKLTREANPEMGYEPSTVLASLARLGMRTSSKNYFVLIGKQQFQEFRAEARRMQAATALAELPENETRIAADLPGGSEPASGTATAIAASAASVPDANSASNGSRSKSYFKVAFVVIGAATLFAALILAKHG